MTTASDHHPFGGEWTELKLAVIDAYASFFSTALKNRNFDLWYVDAFAGTGRRTQTRQAGGLFDNEPVDTVEETLEGSARRALAVQPPFDRIYLIERRKKHFEALQVLKSEYPHRSIEATHGDANDVIPDLLSKPPWAGRAAASQRGLAFLDPYGINIAFSTLECLALCAKLDVWLLVNLKAVVQQLARDHSGIDDSKRQALCRFMGTDAWEGAFYAFQDRGADLFSQPQPPTGHRVFDRMQVAEFYRSRLEDTFRYVSAPLSLKVGGQDDYFQLYCMSNNSSQAALDLIKRGAEGVMKKFGAASRRKSDP